MYINANWSGKIQQPASPNHSGIFFSHQALVKKPFYSENESISVAYYSHAHPYLSTKKVLQ